MTSPTEKRAAGVPLDAAVAWSKFPRGAEYPVENDANTRNGTPRFPVRLDLNDIVRVLIAEDAPPCELDVEVCVCAVSERLIPADDAARAAFDAAGPELRRECDEIGACRTGEAKMTDAHNLRASKLVCTVGPRYVEKYRTAATNALSHCYRGALECCVEAKKRSIALPVVYSENKGFPREHAAHVATRTVRRFLENWPGKLDTVVLCLTNRDAGMYVGDGNVPGKASPGRETGRALGLSDVGTLAAYFPRDDAEARRGEMVLPGDIGNAHGEMDIGEREITIDRFPVGTGPGRGPGSSEAAAAEEKGDARNDGRKNRLGDERDSASILGVIESPEERRVRAQRAKTRLQEEDEFDFWFGDGGDEDGDKRASASGPDSPTARARAAAARHDAMVRAAAGVDLRDVAESGAVRVHGRDFIGRRVVSVDAVSLEQWLKNAGRDRSEAERRVLFHVARVVAPAAADPKGCALVYFHGGGEKAEAPSVDFTRRLVDAALGNGSLEENLKVFYVVHPTAWLQAGMLWGSLTGALSSGVFWKATFVHRLADLCGFISDEAMETPAHAREYDESLSRKA
jgi:O-acetyl-ADP-ribose deacetylase (regulator of RNase III)